MKQLLLLLTLFISSISFSQESIQDAWIYFKDKQETEKYFETPTLMLSERALARREKQNISLDEKDIPITLNYISEIKNSEGIQILAKSKWLNALHIQGTFEQISDLLNKEFVLKIEYADKTLNQNTFSKQIQPRKNKLQSKFETTESYNYGDARNQIEMLKGEQLHYLGYTGNDIHIAVMDAGFPNVDNLEAFKYLRDQNKILGGYDYVLDSENFYTGGSHGTMVLSNIAGNIKNEYVGTAPNASFYLFITEDGSKETPVEESNWVEALEKADSLGVDIVNTSLGYTEYDNPNYSHTYNDLDGKTAFASRGAEAAFSRGMLLVNSAGNSGNSSWKYVGIPADAPSVLSIGAVDENEVIAIFSSYGPTADNRLKPDVCAQGRNIPIINPQGEIQVSNGTSFSSPVLTGVIACLWEAFPEKTNNEIVEMVKKSAHLYNNPNNHEGYGIPNMEKIILENNIQNNFTTSFYPNPVDDVLKINSKIKGDMYEINIFDVLGRNVLSRKMKASEKSINISTLTSGTYIVEFKNLGNKTTQKIIKQ
ncbi:S8 family serine peptidase [Aureivirga sp. CE67]|uniref:S8 family serine peptidase n=1 Tax=Aureivirga sp. CE67 TaxID=1788983 RepID=UPI0018C9E361|nr:S8 family serine peptidase [Aureivirga sp. CE67]